MARRMWIIRDASCIDLPMAVLVNGDSYSAAEFFAAALQEYGVGTVAGQQTCGKGYYQNTFPLEDGSAVAISTGKYFTPKGVSLAGVGITPDVRWRWIRKPMRQFTMTVWSRRTIRSFRLPSRR